MTLRSYQEADEASVVTLWRDVFGYDRPHNDPAVAIRKKLSLQRELFFVAEESGAVVGTIMAGYDGHRGWLYSLAVDPRVRRAGIGSALVRRAEAALAGLGCVKINLQIVAANAGVAVFYEKLGYQVEPRVSMGKVL